jgi:antitoxin component YwqK of YwqJK toxin-antitoxin module
VKYTVLLLTLGLALTTAQANLQATYRNNLLINPNTNQPYTGNLETINNDWGKDAVEYSQEYVNGLRHGSEKAFYKTGVLKSEGNFNQGTIEGVVSLYFEDGSLMGRMNMANNIKEGRGVRYYANGVKQLERFFVKNKLQGTARAWYDTGSLMITEEYKDGTLHGYSKTYYEAGGVFEEVRYEFGTPKYMRVYREDGTIADEKGFFDKEVIKRIVG